MSLTPSMTDSIIDSIDKLTMLNLSDLQLVDQLTSHQLIHKFMESPVSIDSLFLLDFDFDLNELQVLKETDKAKMIIFNRESSFEIIN